MAAPLRDAMIPLRAYIDLVRKRFADMQALAALSAEWVLDGAGAMTPGDAASVAVALERSHPIWFDEPTSVITQDALAKIVDESVMPIGLGRNITDHRGLPESAGQRVGEHRAAGPGAEQSDAKSSAWRRWRRRTMWGSRRSTMEGRSGRWPGFI